MKRINALAYVVLLLASCRTTQYYAPDDVVGPGADGGPGNPSDGGVDLSQHIKPPVPDLTMFVGPPDFAIPRDFSVPHPIVDFALPLPDQERLVDLSQPVIVDLTPPYMPPVDASGFTCGTMSCVTGQQCCAVRRGGGGGGGGRVMLSCMNECPDAGVVLQFSCDGPGNCGGNPCCVSLSRGGGGGGGGGGLGNITCQSAPTDCVPTVDFQTFALTSRLCHVDGDCTAGGVTTDYDQCCSISAMGFTGNLCLNDTIAGFIGGTCN